MCRLFGYVGKSHGDVELLYDNLKKCAANDVLANELGKRQIHKDGWGYVMLSDSGLVHYRSQKAIFEDGHQLPRTSGRTFAMFHARLASNKKLTASIFSHPYVASTKDRVIFLAHNGFVDLGKNSSRKVVDTEYLLNMIAKEGAESAIAKAKGRVHKKSALNLLMLCIERNPVRASLKCLNYYRKDSPKSYFDLYYSRLKGGTAVFSSTFCRYGLKGSMVVPAFGKLMDLEKL